MIISMAWTSEAFIQGLKTATRRDWTEKHAAKFKPGMYVDVWDKAPHRGGTKIGVLKVEKAPYKQALRDMTQQDWVKEGG